jgi:WD40 repeat protein
LQIWDLITATKVRTISLTSHPTDIHWLHDRRYLNVTYGGEKENSVSELYDTFTGELITTYQGDYAELSSDGKYIASEDNVPDCFLQEKSGPIFNRNLYQVTH